MSGHRKWSDIKQEAASRPHHAFTVERDGAWWFVKAVDLPRVFTQVRRLDQAPAAARDVTSLMLDVEPQSFDVDVRLIGEPAVVADRVRSAREQLGLAEEYLAAGTASAVRDLSAAGLSTRDIGRIIGLSHQRVAQLTSANRARLEPTNIDDLMAALEASVMAARERGARRDVDVPLDVTAERIA